MLRISEALKTIAAAGVASAVMITGANAAMITTTGGSWTDVTPNNVTNLSGEGTNTISWGNSAGQGQSQYIFDGVTEAPVDLPGAIGGMTTFNMGNFTHNNRPITGTSITGATLNVPILLENGTLVDTELMFDFVHIETPNTPGDVPDQVSISGSTPTQSFSTNGMTFEFEISGFLQNGSAVDTFFTNEGQANVAGLQGKITKTGQTNGNGPVPVPATLMLLGAGLVALGAVTRRKAA